MEDEAKVNDEVWLRVRSDISGAPTGGHVELKPRHVMELVGPWLKAQVRDEVAEATVPAFIRDPFGDFPERYRGRKVRGTVTIRSGVKDPARVFTVYEGETIEIVSEK
jgi:hypothetical protein